MTDTAIRDSIVGQRFGHIVVTERLTGSRFCGICDCGTKKELRYSDLINGRVTSCGCMRRKPRVESIAGMRSGKLVAIEQTDIKKNTAYLWRCRCDCGKEILTEACRIKGGYIKSCGCSRKYKGVKDITGKKYGRLTAVERLEKKEGHSYKWLCRCDCGKMTEVSLPCLIHGMVKSCGCILVENALKNVENGKGIQDNLHYVDGTCIEQLERAKKLSKNNTSGCTGVIQKRGKWLARITFKGKVYNLGVYLDKEDAIRVRKKAEERLFNDFLDWYYKEQAHTADTELNTGSDG